MSYLLMSTLIFLVAFLACCLFVVREVKYHRENTLFNEHMKILRKRALDKVLGPEETKDAH